MEYEAVIGLEVHVQLDTHSKMFTRVGTGFGQPPNSLTDPVVLGLPGALPVMNREAIEKSIKVGLLLDCKIAEVCKWDRKNYFYPDMPKNYQISQYDQPICEGGQVEIEMPGDNPSQMGPPHGGTDPDSSGRGCGQTYTTSRTALSITTGQDVPY